MNLNSHLSYFVIGWLTMWLMLIVFSIKILTILITEVALFRHSHCHREQWEHCEQQVNMLYRAERQGTPGWHADSQQACWPRSVGHSWTFLTQQTSTTGTILMFSLSMLRWFCSMNTTLPEKCKVDVDNSFSKLPSSLQPLHKQADNPHISKVPYDVKYDITFIICCCAFKIKLNVAIVANVEINYLFSPPVNGQMAQWLNTLHSLYIC